MSVRTASLLVALCCFVGSSGNAQQSQVSTGSGGPAQAPTVAPNAANLDQKVPALFFEGQFLAAINLIERADPADVPAHMKSAYRQLRPALDGFVVPSDKAPQSVSTAIAEDVVRFDRAAAKDAIAEIVERAKKTRVVIVNETHDNPRDRAFVLAVAEALRPLGYTVYAAEGFNNGTWPEGNPLTERLMADGYARRDTGFYIADPMFAHLVRRALQLGYRPLPYEYVPPPEEAAAYQSAGKAESIALRDQGQAANLARAIAAARPNEKFLVHVGYSHAAERPIGPEGDRHEWMAARLARLTGINPLTVEQTELSEYDESPSMRALYARLVPRVGDRPKVFLEDGKPVAIGIKGGATDLQVVHPPVKTVGGRPDWLQRTGRRGVPIPSELVPKKGRRLVQVFGADETADAVPIDQVLVTAGRAAPLVYVLKDGKIRWAVQDD